MTRYVAMQAKMGLRQVRGFTLIELMVAMVLGLLLVAAIGYSYLGTRQTYRQQEALSRMQESARYAFELLTNDIRMAGFTGCGQTSTTNVLNSTSWYSNLFDQSLVGYEGGVSTFPADVTGVKSGTDAVAILRANTDKEYIIDTHNPTSAQFGLTEVSDLREGEILIACDNQHTSIFQMTGPNATGSTATVVHNTGVSGVAPGNCTKGLGSPLACTANGTPYTYNPGSRILRMQGNIYYVGTGASNEPALFRRHLTITSSSDGSPMTEAEELVEGVENLQITYGTDTTGTADGVIDTYLTADQVNTGTVPGGSLSEKWARVLSVKISLLIRSTENKITTQAQAYTYNGSTATPTDLRSRKVFTTVVAVRNRL